MRDDNSEALIIVSFILQNASLALRVVTKLRFGHRGSEIGLNNRITPWVEA